jgi:hypothetical protein
MALWLFERFDLSLAVAGLSYPAAAWIARRTVISETAYDMLGKSPESVLGFLRQLHRQIEDYQKENPEQFDVHLDDFDFELNAVRTLVGALTNLRGPDPRDAETNVVSFARRPRQVSPRTDATEDTTS